MSLGIVELVTMLMGVSGFSVGTNPNAPTPQAALEYALPDADVVAYADIGAFVPGNYKILTGLPNQPQIKASPELAKAVRKMVGEVDGARSLMKGMVGVDFATDISDVTASFKLVPNKDPEFVVALHGKFAANTIDRAAKVAGKQTVKVGSATLLDSGDGAAVGITKNGVIIAGTMNLVRDRLADTWKAPALTTGTNLGNAADVIRDRPVFAVVVGLSPTARKQVLQENKSQNFLTDLVKRHKLWAFSVYKDGIGWTWIDSSKAGLESMAQMSDGAVEVLRAAQIAPRGVAKIILGAIDSYKGANKQVDEIIRRKADVVKIINTYTGDGQFKAQIDKDTRALKLTARLTGKSLSEVVPLGSMLPAAGMAFWLDSRSDATPPAAIAAPPSRVSPPPPPPAKKQGNAPKRP